MTRINHSFNILILLALTTGLIIVALLTKLFPMVTSKVFIFCQKLLSDSVLEIPRAFPDAFVFAIGIMLGIGFLSFFLQLCKTHVLLKKLLTRRTTLSNDLRTTIGSLGLANKVILIRDRSLSSFCCGILSPRVVITTSLVKSLTRKELEAVLLHEQSHLIGRDPIKVLVGKTFSSMFFFLPLFGELYKNIEATNEFLADQWTINNQGQITFIRGALKKILAAPQLSLAVVSNISGPDYFEIRIQRLVCPGIKHKFKLSLASWVTTLLFIFLSWFVIQTPVNASHMDSHKDSPNILCTAEKSYSSQCYATAHLCLPTTPLTEPPSSYYTK